MPLIHKETNYSKGNEMVSTSTEVEDVSVKTHSDVVLIQTVIEKYDLLYPTVKRGEVYLCDFGKPYGSEQ